MEHAAAILHPKLGAPVRDALEQGRRADPVLQEARRAGPRSTFRSATRTPPSCAAISTAMEVRLNDAPRANEIMVAVAVTDSGRPLPRIGGLTEQEIKGEDGLR